MLHRAARFCCRMLYARYLLASAVALGVDFASFLLLMQMEVPAVPASMVGYMFGIGVHWLLSSRLIFARETAVGTSERLRQKVLFTASALVGFAITAVIVGQGLQWGFDPGLTKLIAVGISFQTTYILRRTIVFS